MNRLAFFMGHAEDRPNGTFNRLRRLAVQEITMRTIIAVVLFTFVTCLPVAAWARGEADAQRLASCSNRFGGSLYQQLAGKDGNVLISPHSMHVALAMTQMGARGMTADQIAQVMGLTTMEHLEAKDGMPAPWIKRTHAQWLDAYGLLLDGTPVMAGISPRSDERTEKFMLRSANAIWGQQGHPFRKEYIEKLVGLFEAGLREVDFVKDHEQARKTINHWVEKLTNDKIKDLLKPDVVSRDTRLVLTNAVYFKAAWSEPFVKQATKNEPFALVDGKKVDVPTMKRTASMGYAEKDGVRAVTLMYEGYAVSMTIALPGDGKALADVERAMEGDALGTMMKQAGHRKVRLSLPRFRFEGEYDMIPALKKMGMVDAFEPGKADFSLMDGSKELAVSAVVHKTFIDVNEEGTEAAAATAVAMSRASIDVDEPVEFKVDQPFVFVIRHEPTGVILFVGRVMDPR